MNARFLALWNARTRRERWLLGLMFGLLALVLLWLLLIRPLGDMLSQARERHALAVERLAEARTQAAAIGRLQGRNIARPEGPVEQLVARAAAETGFQLSRAQSEGPGRMSLVIDAARPQTLFAWIGRMEEQGVLVEQLNASANSDRTLAVQITFRARGR